MHIKLVGILSTALLAVQTAQPDPSISGQVERLGLVGALILAVIALWRKNERTEAQKAELTKQLVESTAKLVENTDAFKEVRTTITMLGDRIEKISKP